MNVTRGLPLRAEGVHRVAHAGRLVLRDASNGELCLLNETAAAIWDLCDGQTSIEEMVDAVCTVCSIEAGQATRDIDGALEQLTRIGALEWQPTE